MELDRRNLNRWRSQQNRSLCIPNGGGHWREPEEYTSSLCSHCNSNTQIFHTFFFSFSFSLLLLLPPSSSSAKFKKREGGVDRLDRFDFLTFWLSFLGFSRNKYGNFFFNKRKMGFCLSISWLGFSFSVGYKSGGVKRLARLVRLIYLYFFKIMYNVI